jgi:hypothetical protein
VLQHPDGHPHPDTGTDCNPDPGSANADSYTGGDANPDSGSANAVPHADSVADANTEPDADTNAKADADAGTGDGHHDHAERDPGALALRVGGDRDPHRARGAA